MFKNSGGKVKGVTIIWFILQLVLTVALAIVFGFDRFDGESDFLPLQFFGIIIGGILYSYLSTIFLYAFGQLVESTESIEYLTQEMLEKMDISTTRNNLNTGRNSNIPQNLNILQNPGNSQWQCSKCGRINMMYAGTCGCGNTRE